MFIKLTKVEGEVIVINTDSIETIHPYYNKYVNTANELVEKEIGSTIVMNNSDGTVHRVTQTINHILKLIN